MTGVPEVERRADDIWKKHIDEKIQDLTSTVQLCVVDIASMKPTVEETGQILRGAQSFFKFADLVGKAGKALAGVTVLGGAAYWLVDQLRQWWGR